MTRHQVGNMHQVGNYASSLQLDTGHQVGNGDAGDAYQMGANMLYIFGYV